MIECGYSMTGCAPDPGRSGLSDAWSRPHETTSFDHTWDEVSRSSSPEPSAADDTGEGDDPIVKHRAEAERNDAETRAVAPEPSDVATPAASALDPAVVVSAVVSGGLMPTDTTVIPGGVSLIDAMMRVSSAVVMPGTDETLPSVTERMVDATCTQEQSDIGVSPAAPVPDDADASPIPRPEAAATANQHPTTARPAVSSVGGDLSRASQRSIEVNDQGNVAVDPSPLAGDGTSRPDGQPGSGGGEHEASSRSGTHGVRDVERILGVESTRHRSDTALGEWGEAAVSSPGVDDADTIVATTEGSSGVPTDAVMRTVTRGMVDQIRALRTDGAHAWSLQLEPDEFGSVRVQLLVQDQHVTADILTTHPMIRDLFQQHQGELRQALAEFGLRVDRLSVNVGDAGQQSPNRSWDFGRESWAGREQAPGWTTPRVEPTAAAMGWSPWADAGARHTVNVYV